MTTPHMKWLKEELRQMHWGEDEKPDLKQENTHKNVFKLK